MATRRAHSEFIRQQWRMWIETSEIAVNRAPYMNSFASNGECGLKQKVTNDVLADFAKKFIRQQWRMWIETFLLLVIRYGHAKFIRQQWRMWIETVI